MVENQNTPVDSLWLLARDESMDIRYLLAESHHIAFEILDQLSEDHNPYVAQRAKRTLGRLQGGAVVMLQPEILSDKLRDFERSAAATGFDRRGSGRF